MKAVAVVAALAGLVAAIPQGVSSQLSPTAKIPASCSTDHPASFLLNIVSMTPSKKRDASSLNPLNVTLNNGVLTDSTGRIGGVVSNYQLQFDGPPSQDGTIYNDGFAVCSNGSLLLGGSATWFSCKSGNMSNIYYQSLGAQCSPVYLQVLSGTSTGSAAMTMSDGQVTGSPAPANVICQIGDGQIQQNSCTTVTPVQQLSDGQPYAPTAVVSQQTDGQPVAPGSTSSTTPASAASSTSTPSPVVQVQPTSGSNSTVTTPVAPKKTVSTGSASTIGMNSQAFALIAGLIALFAL